MSDENLGPHESWCDCKNNISEICNCMSSEYIDVIESLQSELSKLKAAYDVLMKAISKHHELWKYNDEDDCSTECIRLCEAIAEAKKILNDKTEGK